MKKTKLIVFYITSLVTITASIGMLFAPFITFTTTEDKTTLSFYEYGIYQLKGENYWEDKKLEAESNLDKNTYNKITILETIMNRGGINDKLWGRFILSFFLTIGCGILYIFFGIIALLLSIFNIKNKCNGAKILLILSTTFELIFIIMTELLVSTLPKTFNASPYIYIGISLSTIGIIFLYLLRNQNKKIYNKK